MRFWIFYRKGAIQIINVIVIVVIGFWAQNGQNEFQQKNTLFGKSNYSMFDNSLKIIDESKMSEIRILYLCHKKSILVDIYGQ